MSENHNKEIRICDNHPEYQVPLIGTFAFMGAEYWCPYCGYNAGMFGAGEFIEVGPEELEALTTRHMKYIEISKEFLHATGTACCSSLVYEGERMSPDELPAKEKNRLCKVREYWQYGIKAEAFDVVEPESMDGR